MKKIPMTGYGHDKLHPSLLRLSKVIRKKTKNQTQLARTIGITPSALTNTFRANRGVSKMQALAIETAFGISHQWLLEGIEPMDAELAKKKELEESKWRLPAGGHPPLSESSVSNLNPTTKPKWYNPDVSLEELTEEHLWIGGSSTPKTIILLIDRLLNAEAKIAELDSMLCEILLAQKRNASASDDEDDIQMGGDNHLVDRFTVS